VECKKEFYSFNNVDHHTCAPPTANTAATCPTIGRRRCCNNPPAFSHANRATHRTCLQDVALTSPCLNHVYKPDSRKDMTYGTLALTITDGLNLKDQDLFGKMDPYVNFQLAAGTNVRNKWRCKTHAGGGKNPSWNDRHNFDLVEGDDRIQAQVYDEDTGSDDLIGSTSIDLNPVFSRGMRDEWFPLQAGSTLTDCALFVKRSHLQSEQEWQTRRRDPDHPAVYSIRWSTSPNARRLAWQCTTSDLRRCSFLRRLVVHSLNLPF
jgi:hypothetical protein